MLRPVIQVGGKSIGDGHPFFVIAEASSNHNRDLKTALGLVEAAAAAGADAVKFQAFTADKIVARMREMTRSTMIMSFPKSREWRVPVRRLRFLLSGCPLFLYSETRVRKILDEAGVRDYDWIALDRDYIVVAHL